LRSLEDVAAVLEQEARDRGDQSRFIVTGQGEDEILLHSRLPLQIGATTGDVEAVELFV
jgi:hypothetical protein